MGVVLLATLALEVTLARKRGPEIIAAACAAMSDGGRDGEAVRLTAFPVYIGLVWVGSKENDARVSNGWREGPPTLVTLTLARSALLPFWPCREVDADMKGRPSGVDACAMILGRVLALSVIL